MMNYKPIVEMISFRSIVELLIVFLAVVAVDIPWLALRLDYHKAFFQDVQKSPLLLRYIPAAIVYLLFAFALLTISIKPAKSAVDAAKRGAVVGAVMYGFYDATNLATLRGWTWEMAIVDTTWGAIAGAITSAIIYRYM
jgi:uncharacterized membrane protein